MTKTANPRMHTAEHILNQAMDRMFGCGRCFSAHIEKKKSKCDYRFDRPLTDEEAAEITARMNHVIGQNLPITEDYMSREQAAGLFNLDRVPDGSDDLRIIRVGDYDACPCIGEHVGATSEIGTFRITTHGFQEGVLRIRFKLK